MVSLLTVGWSDKNKDLQLLLTASQLIAKTLRSKNKEWSVRTQDNMLDIYAF
jgi:hypothetical protein